MGFSVHVVGPGNFEYSRRNVTYGDEWDLNLITESLMRLGAQRAVGAGSAVSGSWEVISTEATEVAVGIMSYVAQAYYLSIAIESLMARHGNGRLDISVRRNYTLRPNTGNFGSIALSGDSGRVVALKVFRFLRRSDMNKWGPVKELLSALTSFDFHYQGSNFYIIRVVFSEDSIIF